MGERAAQRFFDLICTEFGCGSIDARCIVITHLLADRPDFLNGIGRLAPVACLLPKPKTADPAVLAWIRHRYRVESLSRTLFADIDSARDLIDRCVDGRPFVLIDIGGYAAGVHGALSAHYGPRYLGAIEDTENGHQRYAQAAGESSAPVLSVARSPLKGPEDFLVGHSVVFSVEALLREQGDILHGRTACVIGYGKIGSSVAGLLHARRIRTTVFDTDPLKMIDALAHGHAVKSSREEAIRGAGVVICATGNKALGTRDFALLDDGAYVSTVTSSDDELSLAGLKNQYDIKHVSEYITRYKNDKHCFYVLNRGQAVNFIHGAAVGPFIYLVHAEILVALSSLLKRERGSALSDVPIESKRRIAQIWYDVFVSRGRAGNL